jgi:hypothetical protein
MLTTPKMIRMLQTTAWMQEVEQRRSSCRGSSIAKPSQKIGACLVMKNIGKPYARFDEGGKAGERDYDWTIEAPSDERGGNR